MSFLAGHRVVITKQPFADANRWESHRRILEQGGQVDTRVRKTVTLLLTDSTEMAKIRAGDTTMTTKSAAAVKHGIRIITGDDFDRARAGTPLQHLGYLPPAPQKKPPSKAARKQQERAAAQSISRRIDGFFPSALLDGSPYTAEF